MNDRFVPLFLLLLLGGVADGCRTAPPLGAVDLHAPGWRIRQGQAVWTRPPGGEGVAGELLLATRADGACWVQFAKPPFTLATAQVEAGGWRAEIPAARQRRAGRGQPPGTCLWFALADALDGKPVDDKWRFEARGVDGWCLTNGATGEGIEGYLIP